MLNDNALITLLELKRYLGITDNDIATSIFSIYNNSSDASASTIEIDDTNIYLFVTGGTNASSETIALASITIAELITAIQALSKGWVVSSLYDTTINATELMAKAQTACLLFANRIEIQGVNNLLLDDMINAVSQDIENKLGRKIKAQDFEDYFFSGNNRREICLPNYPINSVTSLEYYDQNGGVVLQTYTENTDYFIKEDGTVGILVSAVGPWLSGVDNYRITYNAGYATVPEDLKLACKILCSIAYNKAGKELFKTEKIGQYSYTLNEATPVQVNNILEGYIANEF
ncbi:hypothetical protein KKE60_08090 [Patescibacteria group bacterium]|nr:hypothetical protein [Patescibacteria group bacterium]